MTIHDRFRGWHVCTVFVLSVVAATL